MRRHIYVHFSNYEDFNSLRQDCDFQNIWEYPINELRHHQYEVGKVISRAHFIHILMGTIQCELCPWCNGPPILKEIKDDIHLGSPRRYAVWIECLSCGSQGPKLWVNGGCCADETSKKEIHDQVWARYKIRLPWDHNFVNPYDKFKPTEK